MKKYFPVFTVILTFFFLSSCKPKKNIVYLSNNNFEQEISQAKYSGLHIQEGDKLQILVSAFDDIAVRPFNLSSMPSTASSASGKDSGGSSAAPSEYVVTSEGQIIFPVLGSVKYLFRRLSKSAFSCCLVMPLQ